jgi:mono/diheme cytochrome c family protein
MYFEAIRWSLGLVDGDATPRQRASSAPQATSAEVEDLPAGAGRAAVLEMCSACHGLATSIARRHTRPEWEGLVELMRQRGAPGTDEQATAAIDYLARFFGRQPGGSP